MQGCRPLPAGMAHLTGGLREEGSQGADSSRDRDPRLGAFRGGRGGCYSATSGGRAGLRVLWDPQLRMEGARLHGLGVGQGPPWLEGGWWFAFLLKQPPGTKEKEQDAQTDTEPCRGPLLPSLPVSAQRLTCSYSQERPFGHLSGPATPN